MTFLVKCDGCGKIQEANDQGNYPGNPINPGTGEQWYSRTVPENNHKHRHACSRACIKDDQLVFPI